MSKLPPDIKYALDEINRRAYGGAGGPGFLEIQTTLEDLFGDSCSDCQKDSCESHKCVCDCHEE
jgi:hypothetical protein